MQNKGQQQIQSTNIKKTLAEIQIALKYLIGLTSSRRSSPYRRWMSGLGRPSRQRAHFPRGTPEEGNDSSMVSANHSSATSSTAPQTLCASWMNLSWPSPTGAWNRLLLGPSLWGCPTLFGWGAHQQPSSSSQAARRWHSWSRSHGNSANGRWIWCQPRWTFFLRYSFSTF